MTLLVSAIGALGLALFVSGLPGFQRVRLAQRVTPYVNGPHSPVRPTVMARWRDSPDLEDRLRAAGRRADLGSYRLEQAMWGVGGVAVLWMVVGAQAVTRAEISVPAVAVASGIGFWAGVAARDWWLTRQGRRRGLDFDEDMPVAIDLISLALMAGRSVPEALDRTARALHGATGQLLQAIVVDVRSGTALTDALRHGEAVAPFDSVRRVVDALTTAVEKGSPVVDTLRSLSAEMREATIRQLLETGGRREIAMLVPVVFLILPVTVAIVLLPGIVSLEILVP